MAVRYAVNNGNWSDVATWDGGASLPTVGDDVYANGFTVTVDQNIEVSKISTEVCPTTSVGGGQFTENYASTSFNYRTLVCDIVAGSSTCYYFYAYRLVLTIIGDVYGSDVNSSVWAVCTNNTTTNNPVNDKTINHTGNVYASVGGGIYFRTSNTGCNQYNLIGNIICNAQGVGVLHETSFWESNKRFKVSIIGNVYASTLGVSIYYVYELSLVGNIYGSDVPAIIMATGNENLANINGNIENGGATMAISLCQRLRLSPVSSSVWKLYDTSDNEIQLYTADVLENPPAENDVRSGVVYGIGDAYEGTCAVPAATEVVKGVPVDATVGTWAFNPEVIQRLLNCSTVAITGQQIASYNGAPAELVPTYEKRYDAVYGTPDILYLGAAPVGTLDASTIWDLTKIILATDGSITSETHATDSWDNHLTATYV